MKKSAEDISGFGDRLRGWRLAAQLTQMQLAERARMKQPLISDLERGTVDLERLTLRRVRNLATALDMTVDELVRGEVDGKEGE